MMKTKVKSNACAFDSDSLDEWLESDLRQSGILPSKSDSDKDDKCNRYIKIEESDEWKQRAFGDEHDDKTIVCDSEASKTISGITYNNALLSSTQLAPIIKALLTTIQQQQQYQQSIMIPPLLSLHPSSTSSSPTLAPSSSSSSLAPDSINPLHISKTPSITSSTSETWNTSTPPTPTPAKKRSREMNSAPDRANVVDPLVLKRLKNTDAARRSRQRKLVKMEGLQTRVMELEKLNQDLHLKVAMAERDRDAAKVKESSLREKVVTLETQLAKAHQSLLATVKQEPTDSEKLGNDDVLQVFP